MKSKLGVAIAAGTAVGAGLALRGRRRDDSDGALYQRRTASTARRVGIHEVVLPIAYHRSDSAFAIFSANEDAVREILPSPLLHPVRLRPGRCAFGVFALRHHEASVAGPDGQVFLAHPYGEVVIGPLVSESAMPAAVPFAGLFSSKVGIFVMHMPVTTRQARDLGRVLWGYNKFVADMEFNEDAFANSVVVSEAGSEILRLETPGRGRVRRVVEDNVLYSVLDGKLLRTSCPTIGYARRSLGGGGVVALGAHSVGRDLQQLAISSRSLAVQTMVHQRLLLPDGSPIGDARAGDGFGGRDREFGEYAVTHHDFGRIDLNTSLPEPLPGSGAWSANTEDRTLATASS